MMMRGFSIIAPIRADETFGSDISTNHPPIPTIRRTQ